MTIDRKQLSKVDNVFTAAEASNLALRFVKKNKTMLDDPNCPMINFPIREVADYMNPMMAGDLVSVLGRPQNGKTFLNMWMLSHVLRELVRAGNSNHVAVHITTEVSVERSALYWLAKVAKTNVTKAIRGELNDVEFSSLESAVMRVGALPLFIIGHSTQRSADNKRSRPNLHPQSIDDCIEYILNNYRDPETDQNPEIQFTSIDYLQRLHIPLNADKFDMTSRYVDWAKDLGFWAACPVWLNVQAKREVDQRPIKIPELDDGQFTSNIEQSSDVVLADHMPKVYYIRSMPAIRNIPALKVNPHLMYMICLKQKDGPGGDGWPLYLDYDKQDIGVYKHE